MSQTDMEVARLNVLSGAVQAASSEHGPVDRGGSSRAFIRAPVDNRLVLSCSARANDE